MCGLARQRAPRANPVKLNEQRLPEGLKLLSLLQGDGARTAATHVEAQFQFVANHLAVVYGGHIIAAEAASHAKGESVTAELAIGDLGHGGITTATAR